MRPEPDTVHLSVNPCCAERLPSRGRPVRDPDGQITSWVGVNLDITARKHAEAELGSVDIHLRAKNAPTRWMVAAKLMSVLS
jgi:hypothetical protein